VGFTFNLDEGLVGGDDGGLDRWHIRLFVYYFIRLLWVLSLPEFDAIAVF
jgi:hypothetical protein